MSYCRWSTDDFQCDLYCYEDANGGWITHVAGNRPIGDIPQVDWSLLRDDEASQAEWVRQSKAQSEWLCGAERAPIGLPYDGQSFSDPTLEDFRTRLTMLRKAGYRFPDSVLADVSEEIAALAA